MLFLRRIVFYKDSGPRTSPLSGIPLHDFLAAYCVFTRILSRKRVIECDENGLFFDSNSLEPWITYTHRCAGHREGPLATHIYIYKYIHIYLSTYIYIHMCVHISVYHTLRHHCKSYQNPFPVKKVYHQSHDWQLSGIGLSMFLPRLETYACTRLALHDETLIGRSHLMIAPGQDRPIPLNDCPREEWSKRGITFFTAVGNSGIVSASKWASVGPPCTDKRTHWNPYTRTRTQTRAHTHTRARAKHVR